MNNQPFIGRNAQITALNQLLHQASQNRGSITFLSGEAGIGKSELLATLFQQAGKTKRSQDMNVTYAYCYEHIGNQNAYQPLLDILVQLTRTKRKRGDFAKFILSLIRETGPDWLQMIPGIGPAIAAGLKTAVLSGNWLLNTPEDHNATSQALAAQYADTILKISAHSQPLILVIEDVHWIDEASCQLLQRLVRKIHDHSIAIFLTYRPSYIHEKHPLQSLIGNAGRLNGVHHLSLSGLTKEQISNYTKTRFKTIVHPQLASWLFHLCHGNPLFVSQYLTLLEQSQIVKKTNQTFTFDGTIEYANGNWLLSKNIPIPKTVEAILEQRIQRLVEQDQQLLQNAAVQGENFLSSVLSQLLNKDELELLPRLRMMAERYQMIRYGSAQEGWSEQKAELYAFTHSLMHRAFYNKLSPRERVLYHLKIANILASTIKQSEQTPGRLMLEAAHHFNLGGSHASAAEYYYRAAQNSFEKGAFSETAELCKLTLQNIKADNHSHSLTRLHAESIQLLLISSEMRWFRKGTTQNEFSLVRLAKEGIEAAKKVNDASLLAQAFFLEGRILIATKSLGEAISATKKALKLSRTANDQVGEFIILSYLGYITKAEDFEKGIALSYQAYELYMGRFDTPASQENISLKRHFLRLKGFIGVGEFDRGNYGKAIQWLRESVDGLKQLRMHDDLHRIYNFLSQLYIAIGNYEQAELLLKESIRLVGDSKDPHPWRGYNQALLGKLYLEWERVDEAANHIQAGWQETKLAANVDLIRLVRMYLVELLIHPNSKHQNLDKAEELLSQGLDETMRAGFHDMVIVALSFRSLLETAADDTKTALDSSSLAINSLKELGAKLPSVRAEEILFNHYKIMTHGDDKNERSLSYLQQAYDIVQDKALSLPKNTQRDAFLNRVPLNRAILQAYSACQLSTVDTVEHKRPFAS